MPSREIESNKNFVVTSPHASTPLDNAAQWSTSTGTKAVVTFNGENRLKFTPNASYASLSRGSINPTISIGANKIITLRIYLRAINFNTTVGITVSPTNNSTSRVWFWGSNYLRVGENVLTVSTAEDGTTSIGGATWTVNGAMTFDDPMNFLQIVVQNAVGIDCYIKDFQFGGYARPKIIFGFDSTDPSIDTYAYQTLVDNKIPVYIAAPLTYYGASPITDTANVARMNKWKAAGWQFINHSSNHPQLTTKTDQEVRDELAGAAAWLSANGYGDYAKTLLAYPHNDNDLRVQAVAQSLGFVCARAEKRRSTPTITGVDNMLSLGSINLGGNSYSTVTNAIKSAINYGESLWIYAHALVAGGTQGPAPADTEKWYADDLTALIGVIKGYEKQGLLDLCLPSDWVAGLN